MEKQYEEILKILLKELLACDTQTSVSSNEIPVGVSNRHIHLSQTDLDVLFGKGYELTTLKELSQPGQMACKETVTVVGPKGAIEKVRVLGPVRKATQIEILSGDAFVLGIGGELRMSGDLAGTPGITVVGPKGTICTKEGLIVAKRHIHMLPKEADRFGVKDGDIVSIRVNGPRGGLVSNVVIRATPFSTLECHIDTEEANAFGLTSKSYITIEK